MRLVARCHLCLHAEVSSRERQRSIIVTAGEVKIFAIRANRDHIWTIARRSPVGDLTRGGIEDRHDKPTPPTSRSSYGGVGSLQINPGMVRTASILML